MLTGVIAGVVGGGAILYGQQGVQLLQNQNQKVSTTATSTKTIAKNATATSAYNKVSDAVVSVLNFTKSSQGSYQESSEGSGVIYKKTDGSAFIVTNNHVVSGSSAIRVIMSDGTKLSAKIVGTDSVTDLAVLKINSSKVTKTASFGNSDNIKVGETALAIGSPMGSNYATTLTQGIISAKKRTVATTNTSGQTTGYATVIQTDTAINSGNSGGPLFNIAGQVIGINSMKLASDNSGTSVEGMGFAIPSNEVVKIINELVQKGEVVRPALGVATYDLSNISSSDQKSVLKLPTSVTKGVVIMKTYSGSPAKAAGLTKYDVITELGGKKVTSLATLRSALYAHSVNDTVTVKYYHNGKLKTANMKLTETTKTLTKQSN